MLMLHERMSSSVSSYCINLSLTATRSVNEQDSDLLMTAKGSSGSPLIGINHPL